MSQPTSETNQTLRTVNGWIEEAAELWAPDVFQGKRRSPRHVWPAAFEGLIDRGKPTEICLTLTAKDVGLKGMGVFCRRKLPVSAVIWLRRADGPYADVWVRGKVVHNTQTVGGYHIGIEFVSRADAD